MNDIEFNKTLSRIRSKGSIKSCIWGEDDPSSCSGKIVKAHSIQRSKILKNISEDGMVSVFSTSPNSGFKTEGIGKFSTFSGFCKKHDKEIFQPIEDFTFNGSEEQFYIYAFRSASKEYHGKKEIVKASEHVFHENTGDIATQMMFAQLGKEKHLGSIELAEISTYLKSCIEQKSYSGLKNHYFCMNREYPLACSSCFIPYFDHNGKSIITDQESLQLAEKTFPPKDTYNVYLNVFPEGGKTHVLMSYFKGRKKQFEFVRKMLKGSLSNIQINITNIILNNCENVAFSPSYIRSNFTQEELSKIDKAFRANVPDVTNTAIIDISLFQN